ncbi:glycosyltransferase 87 family protein, partial [Streptomyces kebangsaanensis]|uniref:glycosyltransferase 87 family protein n=1 Tax=Streptomyces kebangsaanensis TaxID=864058 RepID=UPI001F21E9F4
RAAAWAGATVATAAALAWCVAPRESARYWSALVTDTRRVGPVWSVRNQSLRGALGRLLGQDTAAFLAYGAALALVTVVTAWAVRAAVRRSDLLGVLVAVELYGLLVSPVSWSHHWIWCLPAMIWLAHGPLGQRLLSRVTLAVWALVTVTRVVPSLIRAEDHRAAYPGAYPASLAWPGCVYAVCAVLTLAAIARGTAGHEGPAVASGAVPEPSRAEAALGRRLG